MQYIFLIFLFILSSCSSLSKKPLDLRKLSLIKESKLSNLESLSLRDLAFLDKEQYLIHVESATTENYKINNVGIVFVNESLKQQGLTLGSIHLKKWIEDAFLIKNYQVERINKSTQVVVLVEYGVNNVPPNPNIPYKLHQRFLSLRALDYKKLKIGELHVFWEMKISSIGVSTEINKILPILASFIENNIGTNFENHYLLSINDPQLERTKKIPSGIIIDDFKPTVEELNFFN